MENNDITINENGWEKETHKNGVVKTMFQLFDPYFYEGVCKILTLGAQKYKPNNWINGDRDEYARAVESHWNAYKKGNKLDNESGLSHLFHMTCNAMFLYHFDRVAKKEVIKDVSEKVYIKG